MDGIELTIDERAIVARPGQSVLEVALASGIEVPRLCHFPGLSVSGGCRMCLVEVEGRNQSQQVVPSCGLAPAPGMRLRTQSPRLVELRREVLSLILSDHPMRCSVCDKAGACELQRYAYDFGLAESTHEVEISRSLYQDDNPFFVRDHQYCILCARCVRVCEEIVGASAIELVGRGFATHVGTPFDGPMIDSSCVFCGNCVAVCPTASLMPRARLGKGREWELQRTRTLCGYCGVGCGITVATRNGRIVDVAGDRRSPVNGDYLCSKGRFGWGFIQHLDRLTRPLVRRELAIARGIISPDDGALSKGAAGPFPAVTRSDRAWHEQFVETSWEMALDLVAERLADIVRRHGPDSVAGLASARCTNEENYLFQKLMRVAIGTNNVDHCARLCHSSTVTGLIQSFGSGAMTNSIRELRDVDCLLVTGSNTSESHPVISYELVQAVRRGASLIVIDPRRIPLTQHATLHLQPLPGTDVAVFLAIANVIVARGWADDRFIAERTENYEAFAAAIRSYTPELASQISGVPAALIVEAAERYALGRRRDEPLGDRATSPPGLPFLSGSFLIGAGTERGDATPPSRVGPAQEPRAGGDRSLRGNSTILYAMGITQRSRGTEGVQTLANLALLTGQIGRPHTGVDPLRGQANVQGACDVGTLPDVYPGYRRVADPTVRAEMAAAWDVEVLPPTPGLTVVEMMKAAVDGQLKALYVMGENPALSDPNIAHVDAALQAVDFLVVQEIVLSETARWADVVLPAASFAEKEGTFTNTERRVQLLRPAVASPGEAKTDLTILGELGARLDAQLGRPVRPGRSPDYWRSPSAAAVMEEIARVTPIYRGIRHHRLDPHGLHWPCPSPEHPGTPILHGERFSRGKGHFQPIEFVPAAELPDAEYPLILTTGRELYHYHTGTQTRRAEPLDWREPRGYAELNVVDAERAGIRDGGPVEIASRRGKIRTQARVGNVVPPGVVFVPFHFREAPANVLTRDDVLDPQAKIPEYKVTAVRIASPSRRALATDGR